MRIPQVTAILTTYEPIAENLFNPILHASPESVREGKKVHKECMCHSTDPDDFYPKNKRRCRYCCSKRILALRNGEVKPSRKRSKKNTTK